MIAIKDQQVIFEAYKPGFEAQSKLLGTSMSKSLLSVSVGIALCSEKIKSLDNAVGQYVAAITSPTFKNTKIRDLLTMTSGSGDSWTLQSTYPVNTGFAYGKRFVLGEINRFSDEPKNTGSSFAYSDHNANLIGLVLEGATGKPLAAYLQESVWSAIGAESDAL